MTTPPEKLVAGDFWYDGKLPLRDVAGLLVEEIDAVTALSLAHRGEIEGVGPRSGKIRFLRMLPPHVQHKPHPPEVLRKEETHQSSSTGFARTNLGVYREAIEHKEKMANALAAGVIIGYCYAHCQLRGSGL